MQIDVVQHLGAVDREVLTIDHPDGEQKAVVLRRTYDTDPADLWQALTDQERIPRWFQPVTGDLQLGGRFQIEGNAGGEVVACDEPEHFAITWEFGGEVSWVDVLLTPDGDGTRFELQHRAKVGGEHWDMFGPGAVGIGWDLSVLGLALHLESGGAQVDPVEVEAWSTGPEGVAYITGSGEAWGAAELASGVPADVNARRTKATIDAYTGAGEHPDHDAS
jgi:uncharacterized protein YndB with AHSA1/START domain